MLHSQKELNQICDNIKSGKQKQQADAVRPMADPSKPDCLPELRTYPDGTEELSVPIRDNTDRAVYKRPPGGCWVEAVDSDPLTFFAADTRSAAMKTMQDGFRLIRKARPNADPDLIVQAIAGAFEQLNNNPNAVISAEAIFQHAIKTIV